MRTPSPRIALAGLVASAGLIAALSAQEARDNGPPARWKQHDMTRPKPPVVEPADDASLGAKPPKDAVVLFDGSNLDAWKSSDGSEAKWKVADGAMQTVPGAGAIQTKKEFGDIQLHVEWSTPDPPRGTGQDRGNSGVFLMGQFEIQVLDSYQAETYADGQAGAIYGQFPPLANASRPPGKWQSYDIAFRRPRFDDSGRLLEPARITVFQNGILIQNNEEPFGPTFWLKWGPYVDKGGRGPISLQDHDHPVRYRNIWLRELPERPQPSRRAMQAPQAVAVSQETLESYAGNYRLGSKPNASIAKIAREGDHLTLTLPFRPGPLELIPTSQTEFAMPFTDGKFTFHKDDKGKVTGALFHIGDSERELTKAEK